MPVSPAVPHSITPSSKEVSSSTGLKEQTTATNLGHQYMTDHASSLRQEETVLRGTIQELFAKASKFDEIASFGKEMAKATDEAEAALAQTKEALDHADRKLSEQSQVLSKTDEQLARLNSDIESHIKERDALSAKTKEMEDEIKIKKSSARKNAMRAKAERKEEIEILDGKIQKLANDFYFATRDKREIEKANDSLKSQLSRAKLQIEKHEKEDNRKNKSLDKAEQKHRQDLHEKELELREEKRQKEIESRKQFSSGMSIKLNAPPQTITELSKSDLAKSKVISDRSQRFQGILEETNQHELLKKSVEQNTKLTADNERLTKQVATLERKDAILDTVVKNLQQQRSDISQTLKEKNHKIHEIHDGITAILKDIVENREIDINEVQDKLVELLLQKFGSVPLSLRRETRDGV